MRFRHIIDSIALALETRYAFLLGIILATTAALAWLRRFVVDDAFISFRYARNLTEGHGLVFNIGDRLEGYTNFLWTLLMALPHAIGVDPIQFCYVIGPVLAVVTVYLTGKIALRVTESKIIALAVVLLVGTQPTFSAWATGGLETQLLASILTAIFWFTLKDHSACGSARGCYLSLSLLSAAALMTRLDSAIVVGTAMAATAVRIGVSRSELRTKAISLVVLMMPAACLIGAWFWWKLDYYGELLPNTYYAKMPEGSAWPTGLVYLWHFVNSYLLWPLLLLLLLGVKTLIKSEPIRAVSLIVSVMGYIAYVIHAGGDFMEFRMLVPIIPALYIVFFWTMHRLVSSPSLKSCVVAVTVAGSVHHAVTFSTIAGIESVERLTRNLHGSASNWVGIGRVLNRDLGVSVNVRIALTPVGAIPYYSRLPTLDMLGLVDRWVAHNGLPVSTNPGHRRIAQFSYVAGQGIHLLIGHPWVEPIPGKLRENYRVREMTRLRYLADLTPIVFPTGSTILEIPLDSGRMLVAVYLTRHAAIDALIADGRWRAVRLTNRN